MEHSYVGNTFMSVVEWLLSPEGYFHKARLVWAGDYAGTERSGETLYEMTDAAKDRKITPEPTFNSEAYPFLVNHSQQLFVKKPARGGIHPLSILTAEGNGRGGGDYRGYNEGMAGRWARDIVSVEKEVPEGYEELDVEFGG
jgi:hypothetical protein